MKEVVYMFDALEKRLKLLVKCLNNGSLSLNIVKKTIWQLTQNKFNYPLRLVFSFTNDDQLKKMDKPTLISQLQDIIKQIDDKAYWK